MILGHRNARDAFAASERTSPDDAHFIMPLSSRDVIQAMPRFAASPPTHASAARTDG